MDYSQNSFFSTERSDSYYRKKPITISNILKGFIFGFCGIIYLVFLIILLAFHILYASIAPKKYSQYRFQSILKEIAKVDRGIKEYEIKGRIYTNILTYRIDRNLWFEYELEGDYKDKIRSISLKRNVITEIWMGMERKRQYGWIITFTFSKNPEEGRLILRHV